MGYDDAPATAASQRQLADLLQRRFSDGVWWIHNHHLAKNTRFTGAVLLAAAAGQPMILQIHDFPENARPANLARLMREVPTSPYPAGANVRYAVLNRRDHGALVAAGCPADRVALLGNPVRTAAPIPAPDAETARAARARLAGRGVRARAGGQRLLRSAPSPVAVPGTRPAPQERAGGGLVGAARRSQPGRHPARLLSGRNSLPRRKSSGCLPRATSPACAASANGWARMG